MLSNEDIASEPPKRGRRGRRKGKVTKEFKLDKESKNRIRNTPEIMKFYAFIKRYRLRNEAFKTLLLNGMSDADSMKVRRLFNNSK